MPIVNVKQIVKCIQAIYVYFIVTSKHNYHAEISINAINDYKALNQLYP